MVQIVPNRAKHHHLVEYLFVEKTRKILLPFFLPTNFSQIIFFFLKKKKKKKKNAVKIQIPSFDHSVTVAIDVKMDGCVLVQKLFFN